jgi:hypothetical protein
MVGSGIEASVKDQGTIRLFSLVLLISFFSGLYILPLNMAQMPNFNVLQFWELESTKLPSTLNELVEALVENQGCNVVAPEVLP